MTELSAHQISDLLRKCSGGIICDGCPLHAEHPKCVRTLMQSAASMIDEQAKTIQSIRTFVRGNK